MPESLASLDSNPSRKRRDGVSAESGGADPAFVLTCEGSRGGWRAMRSVRRRPRLGRVLSAARGFAAIGECADKCGPLAALGTSRAAGDFRDTREELVHGWGWYRRKRHIGSAGGTGAAAAGLTHQLVKAFG